MTLIPQYKVSKVWRALSKHCKEKGCLEECSEQCNFRKAKEFLHQFTENGRQVHQGLYDVKFQKETREFDQEKVEGFLNQIEGLCQKCGEEEHIEQCFINRSRQALQLIIYGKTRPCNE
ncbi:MULTISPECIES: hypothetical protein [unclassified Candidatus Frackibacter]|uniref:hypothetical protein n=1 Tax=unclassified Candidatus Frackibacter TaxID=2648818 RepID=UPI00079435B1|nr:MULTISPECIES: hypothetical protein [unclassified Candidatus Frackibacter]KXS41071.1 MAG: hypothetical protein AWU54_1756 [Candidatus Frackibacter sp. T328-2]SDC12731.1 hypothetical protein SAMN04515661_102192 [Candidatus Frackibacter sp. WG11]SEM35701.1 hypothetical protein SAMN04488698_10219 [Candidatus Frackibacter sp. WG12]SFL40857.1 hypothetical protein SAMN04488699_10219 [Candidatus Frackibacter sp. WG13]